MDKIQGMTLTPAYGADYKSRKEVIEGLNKSKDFVANHCIYCSVKDLADGEHAVRYAKLAKVVIVKIKDGVAS